MVSARTEPRVLLLIDALQINGVGSVTVAAALGLRERGQDVRVAHLGIGDWRPLADQLARGGVPVVHFPLGSLCDLRVALRLAAYVRRESVEIVHTHNRYAHLIGRPAAALAGRPAVSTIHYLVDDVDGRREAVRRWLDHLTARWLCARLILVSRAQQAIFSRAAGLPVSRLQTLPNAVDTDRFRPDPAARARLRAELDLAPDGPVFATLGVLRPGKAVGDLLEAAATVLETSPDASFLVIGDGPERERLIRQAEQLGLAARVRFTGTRLDVAAVLAAADVYVHPSHAEALPTSVLEAMAVGLAVVATEVGGVPEIVQDQRTGLLVKPGRPRDLAAAMRCLLEPSRRVMLGQAARSWVAAHASLPPWLDQLQALYRDVANRRGPA